MLVSPVFLYRHPAGQDHTLNHMKLESNSPHPTTDHRMLPRLFLQQLATAGFEPLLQEAFTQIQPGSTTVSGGAKRMLAVS